MSTAGATAAGAPIGPVDLAVIGFRGELREGGIRDAVARAVERGAVRVLDVLLVRKDDDGSVRLFDAESPEGAEELLVSPRSCPTSSARRTRWPSPTRWIPAPRCSSSPGRTPGPPRSPPRCGRSTASCSSWSGCRGRTSRRRSLPSGRRRRGHEGTQGPAGSDGRRRPHGCRRRDRQRRERQGAAGPAGQGAAGGRRRAYRQQQPRRRPRPPRPPLPPPRSRLQRPSRRAPTTCSQRSSGWAPCTRRASSPTRSSRSRRHASWRDIRRHVRGTVVLACTHRASA